GRARDARGGARLPRSDRRAARRQAGRRHPRLEGGRPLPRHGERDGRRRVAHPAAVPIRRIEPAQRPAPAAAQAGNRRLRRSRLRDGGLMVSKFDYAPAPESRDIARLKPSYQIFVDGQFRDGTGDAVKTINPADEEPLAEIAEAGPSDVDDAIAA